jgi:acetoin utilization deacetylase AcuC-like enzyme
MTVAYVLDEVFEGHRPPGQHPERPERAAAVREALRGAGLGERGMHLATRAAQDDELGRVHRAGYLADLGREVPGKSGWLDGDTYYSPGTWDAALKAAGAAVDVAGAVLRGEAQRGLAVVRPPGHHAEADRAMGFCLFNNVAVAAAAARAAGAARVAVLDWDVHHGNGTQHMFYDDPSVLYLSVHQYPYYPGTGAPSEIGAGDAAGTTVNVGFPPGCGDPEYLAAFDEVFVPAMRRFAPDLVLVSAGFDAYVADPLAGMRVTAAGYRAMAERMVALADLACEGRVAFVLEGGYDLEGLGSGMREVLEAAERGPGDEARRAVAGEVEAREVSAGARRAIDATLAAHAALGGGA